jgi:hypothetical protein
MSDARPTHLSGGIGSRFPLYYRWFASSDPAEADDGRVPTEYSEAVHRSHGGPILHLSPAAR